MIGRYACAYGFCPSVASILPASMPVSVSNRRSWPTERSQGNDVRVGPQDVLQCATQLRRIGRIGRHFVHHLVAESSQSITTPRGALVQRVGAGSAVGHHHLTGLTPSALMDEL